MKSKRKPHEILTELELTGDLKVLVQGGFCSPCVVRNMEIYRFIDARVKTGSKVSKTVLDAETTFGVCRQTVFNAWRCFK